MLPFSTPKSLNPSPLYSLKLSSFYLQRAVYHGAYGQGLAAGRLGLKPSPLSCPPELCEYRRVAQPLRTSVLPSIH